MRNNALRVGLMLAAWYAAMAVSRWLVGTARPMRWTREAVACVAFGLTGGIGGAAYALLRGRTARVAAAASAGAVAVLPWVVLLLVRAPRAASAVIALVTVAGGAIGGVLVVVAAPAGRR